MASINISEEDFSTVASAACAAAVVDECNREGPYNAIGAANRIRALVVTEVKAVRTVGKDFL